MCLCGNAGFAPAQCPEGSILFPVVQMEDREKTWVVRHMRVPQAGQIHVVYEGNLWDTKMGR